jgi:8-oxo-dGTP diphosphatase
MIRVAVGVIMRNGKADGGRSVLLCQRKETAKYPLKWEFPGGKVEDGEEVADCLARELREELGVTIGVPELFHRQEARYPDSGHYEVYYYLVDGVTGAMVNRVFQRIEWVGLRDLSSYDILEGNRDVVDKLIRTSDAESA